MHSESAAYHALARRTGGSYTHLARLRVRHASWTDALASEGYGHAGNAAAETALAALADLRAAGIRLILRNDPEFPPLLREIPHPPHALYIKSKAPAAATLAATTAAGTIAIVGTRKATSAGKAAASAMARELAMHGLTVISGLAYGIDAAAHAGCLDARGRTLAVLAHGLDQVHPSGNARLAERILAEGGALISEYPPGFGPLAYRFLERNRIVSGLCQATVVIEAPARSGVIATSRFTLEQNRHLLVVPGPAAHANFQGSHQLIRSGAMLVRHARDVLEELGLADAGGLQSIPAAGSEAAAILTMLRNMKKPLTIDEIIETTNLLPSVVHQNLTFLLLDGMVREKNGGYTFV